MARSEGASRVQASGRAFLTVVLLLALITVSGGAVSATNPPEFITSDPVTGTTITTPPTQVVLIFSHAMDPGMTGGYVHNVDGVIVSTSIKVSADDPTIIVVSLAPNLTSGWYMVMWNTALVGSDELLFGDVTFEIA